MPAKKRIEKNRSRYRTVAFRMSHEEWAELNERIALSGHQRQDYLIKSTLYQQIVVIGNVLLFEKMNDRLDTINEELKRIEKATEMDEDLLAPIRTMVEILEGFKLASKP